MTKPLSTDKLAEAIALVRKYADQVEHNSGVFMQRTIESWRLVCIAAESAPRVPDAQRERGLTNLIDRFCKALTLAGIVALKDSMNPLEALLWDARAQSVRPLVQSAEQVRETSNLLAVIHRDGGHYEDEHGPLQAIKDAKEKIIKAFAKSEFAPEPCPLPEKWRKLQIYEDSMGRGMKAQADQCAKELESWLASQRAEKGEK